MSAIQCIQSSGVSDCVGVVSQSLVSTSRIFALEHSHKRKQQSTAKIKTHSSGFINPNTEHCSTAGTRMTPHELFVVTNCTEVSSAATSSTSKQHSVLQQDCGQSGAPQCERSDELICLHLLHNYSSSAQRKLHPLTLSHCYIQNINL